MDNITSQAGYKGKHDTVIAYGYYYYYYVYLLVCPIFLVCPNCIHIFRTKLTVNCVLINI